jgi:5'-methylthioadenosine phosphorylase|tara:strand:- start:46 stop:894 length:849 start_codon:yes stop_codon:yes gene_type:complete
MLGIIGGSGLYQLEGLQIDTERTLTTPFGAASAAISCGQYGGQQVLFLARHGREHQLLPHEINYRANIYALKALGARRIISFSAAGSLRQELKPGDLALVEQYFDHTRGRREQSFFSLGVAAHVSTANPVCAALNSDIERAAAAVDQPLHIHNTYACVEGPRLGTRAESFFLRDAVNCDLVGMTNLPEAFLAREAQIAYSSLCLITDYDCWMDDPSQHVSVEKFFEIYSDTLASAIKVLKPLVASPFTETPHHIRQALKSAVLTPRQQLSSEQQQWLEVLER